MKTLDATQALEIVKTGIQVVDLVRLQTYTDRDAGTVDSSFYFGGNTHQYDYGNLGTDRQFEPLLRSISITAEEMPHLPDPIAALSGVLAKRCTIALLNRERETGNRLIEDLRADNLEGATIEWAQLMLAPGDSWSDLTSYTGDEHTVRYRGELTRVIEITDETIELEFQTDAPRIPWIVASDATENDPRDLGRRLPIVYGDTVRVQAVGWEVGSRTTLAEKITASQTGAIEFTDTSAFPSSGTIAIGSEIIDYTNNASNQLTLSVRGADSSTAAKHTAGDIVVEMIATATWIVAGHEVEAIGDVYIENPFNQEITRVTDAFTKTPDDAVTIGGGVVVASISFTQAQIQTMLDTLAAAAAVDQQPARSTNVAVSHPIVYELTTQFPDNHHDRVGITSGQCDTVIENSTHQTGLSTNDRFEADFPTPDGTIISQNVKINYGSSFGASNSDMEVRKDNGSGTQIILQEGAISGLAQYESGAITDTPDFNTVYVRLFNGSSSSLYLGYLKRENIIISGDPPDVDTQPEVAETDGTEVKISAASVGYGLRFYADVDGMMAPSADYLCGDGNLITEMPDVLRHLLEELAEPNQICETDWNDAGDASHLNDNAHAVDLRNLGGSFPEIAQTLAWESRANLMREERNAQSEWRMLVAESDYDWPASVRTVTEWQAFIEEGRDLTTIQTRFRGLYQWRPEYGIGPEAFYGVVRIDVDQNDVSVPSTGDLTTAEAAFGRRENEVVLFRSINQEATAEEILGYYAHERIRVVRLFRIVGVPWSEGFDLERGDIISATPPWESSPRKMRLTDYVKDPTTELCDLIGVEVA